MTLEFVGIGFLMVKFAGTWHYWTPCWWLLYPTGCLNFVTVEIPALDVYTPTSTIHISSPNHSICVSLSTGKNTDLLNVVHLSVFLTPKSCVFVYCARCCCQLPLLLLPSISKHMGKVQYCSISSS